MGFFGRFFRRKQVFAIAPADREMWSRTRREGIGNLCNCFPMQGDAGRRRSVPVNFHSEPQDVSCEAWRMLEEMIRRAATRGAAEFAPGLEMPPELWAQIITLPASIAELKKVRRLYLYGSYLVRLPPEIGEMTSLEELDLYTSYRLHWLPFEVTRCKCLKNSRISTRALYGNYKYRPNFPSLNAIKTDVPGVCSVCREPMASNAARQVWLSLRIATDVVPLLVNACSDDCIRSLPTPATGYVDHPHKGGVELAQPEAGFVPPR